MSLVGYSPLDRLMRRAFEPLFDDDFLPRRSYFPYWRDVPFDNFLSMGSGLGEIENTPEKFAASLDVSHFKPEEIKVNLNEHELTIEGYHEERNDQHGRIQRSFVRKYTLPEDANVEALRSSLDNKGHLVIEAPKRTPSLTQSRAIPITMG